MHILVLLRKQRLNTKRRNGRSQVLLKTNGKKFTRQIEAKEVYVKLKIGEQS